MEICRWLGWLAPCIFNFVVFIELNRINDFWLVVCCCVRVVVCFFIYRIYLQNREKNDRLILKKSTTKMFYWRNTTHSGTWWFPSTIVFKFVYGYSLVWLFLPAVCERTWCMIWKFVFCFNNISMAINILLINYPTNLVRTMISRVRS